MKKIFIAIITFFIPLFLFSEESRGKFFIEGTYGQGFDYRANPTAINPFYMNRDFSFSNSGEVVGVFTGAGGTTEEKLLSIYVFKNAPKPKISGQNQSLLFEYVFFSRLGIGLSFDNSEFQAKNLSYSLTLRKDIPNVTKSFIAVSQSQ